jgi:hypothetical protein
MIFDITILILDHLKEKRLTISDFSKEINKPFGEVIKWFTGDYDFDLYTICTIEAALNVDLISIPKR